MSEYSPTTTELNVNIVHKPTIHPSLVQFDAPRMTLCVAITGWDSLENTQFVVVLSSFVISPISGDYYQEEGKVHTSKH
jgi:hypothetical protein